MRPPCLLTLLFTALLASSGCSGDSGTKNPGDDDDDGGFANPGPGGIDVPVSNGPTQPLPDLTVNVPMLEASLEIDTVNTASYACAVQEGCFGGTGIRQVLRFSVGVPNIGEADAYIGDPSDNPEDFEYSNCSTHNHYHFLGFANYEMSGPGGAAFGHKQAFCLMDLDDYGEPGPNPQENFDCSPLQGISVGWQDIYGSYLDCQWVDITDLPDGDYELTVTVNAENKIAESGPGPNSVTIPVTLPLP